MYVVKQNYNLDRDLWSRIKMEGNKSCHLLHYVERGKIRRGSGAEKFGSQGLESKGQGHAGVDTPQRQKLENDPVAPSTPRG